MEKRKRLKFKAKKKARTPSPRTKLSSSVVESSVKTPRSRSLLPLPSLSLRKARSLCHLLRRNIRPSGSMRSGTKLSPHRSSTTSQASSELFSRVPNRIRDLRRSA